ARWGADRGTEPGFHTGRPGHADGRAAAALLDAVRRRDGARRGAGEGGAAAGRGPDALPGQERHLRAAGQALSAPPRRYELRLGRGVWPALQLPRLAVRRARPVLAAAVR